MFLYPILFKIKKEIRKVLIRKNLPKSNFNSIVKVHMELLLLGCSQPTRSNIKRKKEGF
jgi:hypothetical protein